MPGPSANDFTAPHFGRQIRVPLALRMKPIRAGLLMAVFPPADHVSADSQAPASRRCGLARVFELLPLLACRWGVPTVGVDVAQLSWSQLLRARCGLCAAVVGPRAGDGRIPHRSRFVVAEQAALGVVGSQVWRKTEWRGHLAQSERRPSMYQVSCLGSAGQASPETSRSCLARRSGAAGPPRSAGNSGRPSAAW